MHLNPNREELAQFTYQDFELQGYEAHPHIAAPIAV